MNSGKINGSPNGLSYAADGVLDRKMSRLIAVIESAKEFNEDELGEASGLGEEATTLYREYVAAKALVTRAAINFFRIGLQDTFVLVYVEYPLMRALNEALQGLLSTPGSYLVGVGSPLGQNLFITRHLIPHDVFEKYVGSFDELVGRGIIKGYEVMKSAWPAERYSPDPSVFDYATGNWKRGTYSLAVERKVTRADTQAVPFDDVDLKILTMLKRSAATSLSAISAATGLSIEEVNAHLTEHVLGSGDPHRSMIAKYYLDFMEPGLFASDTMMVSLIAEPSDDPEELLKRLVSIPYLSAMWYGEKVFASLYAPLQGICVIIHEIETIGAELKLKDLTIYISPWYYWNVLGSLHSPASLERNYRSGRWIFEKGLMVDAIANKVKSLMPK